MKKYLAAIALAAAFAQPATAITFPAFTTIYVGGGVIHDGAAQNTGVATSFICTNVSGLTARIRFLVLDSNGVIRSQQTVNGVSHGEPVVVSTHFTVLFPDSSLATGAVFGTINIESTESAVFCQAMIVDAASFSNLAPLRLVRVNPHPGTVE